MNMPANPQLRERLITKALHNVSTASRAQRCADDLPGSADNQQFLEASVRSAIGYGYPIETVASAAAMTIDEITAIAHRPIAA